MADTFISGRTGVIDGSVSTDGRLTGTVNLPNKPARHRPKFREPWSNYMLAAMGKLSSDNEFTLQMWRVYGQIMANLEFGNYFEITQKYIADQLEIPESNVSLVFKKLIKKKIIVVEQEVGKRKKYRVHHDYVWRGSTDTYDQHVRAEQRKLQKARSTYLEEME